MKLQSAVEFLSTYGFMFLLVGLILVAIFYLAFPVQSVIQNQCAVFGDLQCSFALFHVNSGANSANVIFYMSNSGGAPINVLNANVIINGKTFQGTCNPTLISPAGHSICSAIVTPSESVGTQVHGYLTIAANFCNSAVYEFSNTLNCTYTPAYYSGEFFSYANFVTANSISTTSTSSLTSSAKSSTIKSTACVPITYGGSGELGNWYVNGPAGYSTYICSAANWYPYDINAFSWEGVQDSTYSPSQGNDVASVGRQNSATCSASLDYYEYDSMVALGLNNVPTPTIQSSQITVTGSSTSFSYTIPTASSFVVVSIACADEYCSSIVPSASPTATFSQNVGTGYYGTIYTAVYDYNQGSGTSHVTITTPGSFSFPTEIAWAVYDYGPQCT